MSAERDPRAGVLPTQDEISARFAAGDMRPAREACPLCKVVVEGLIFDGRGEGASVFLPAQSIHHVPTCPHFRDRARSSGSGPAAPVTAAGQAELLELLESVREFLESHRDQKVLRTRLAIARLERAASLPLRDGGTALEAWIEAARGGGDR